MIDRYAVSVKRSLVDIGSDGRGRVLTVIAAGWALSIGVRMIYPVLLPQIRETYDLGLSAAGLLFTLLFVAYAIGQLPGGVLADRTSERSVLALSMLLSGIMIGLITVAASSAVLFISTALYGFVTGLYAVARFTVLYDLYSDRLGTANGIVSSAADAGQSILPPVAGLLAGILAWQVGFGYTIPIFLVAAASLWLFVPESTKRESTETPFSFNSARTIVSQLRDPNIITGTLIAVIGISMLTAFTGFYPTYLIEEKGISSTATGILFGLFFAAGVVIKPFAGFAYDRIGYRLSLFILMGTTGVGMMLLPFVNGVYMLLVVTGLSSMLLGFGTVAETYLIATLPQDIQGTGFGVLRTSYIAIGALSPMLIGTLADRGFFDEAFLILAVFAGISVLIAARMPDV